MESQDEIFTDWVSYTPTGAYSTNTTYAGKWRRIGDTMEVNAYLELRAELIAYLDSMEAELQELAISVAVIEAVILLIIFCLMF